ncbi:hypothetical protein C8R43DRAFT_1117695 [Mycena crocata]|nr:hypothetical protein C8R43DRAFT_1117695 [Mycena crocata]
MAAQPHPNQGAIQDHLVARPGANVRPETRTKVIELLAGTANSCLQELGYSPGLLERVRFYEKAQPALQQQNEELHARCAKYQEENVKLYDDNTKLLANCKILRKKLAATQAFCVTFEQNRDKTYMNILKEFAIMKEQYADAVNELKKYAKRSTPAAAVPLQTSASQLQPIRPTVVPSQQPFRRSSAPQLHSPLAPQQQQPYPMASLSQPHPHPSVMQISQQRKYSSPLGWSPQSHPASPLTPTSATRVPPPIPNPPHPTYPARAPAPTLNPAHPTYSSLIPRGGAAPGPNATTFPPTPPMSALPLNLQNFASPAHPQRSASASSSSGPASVAGPSPAEILYPPSASAPPTPPDEPSRGVQRSSPLEVPIFVPPLEMQDGAPHQSSTPPEAHEAVTPPPQLYNAAGGRVMFASESQPNKRASPEADGEDPRKKARLDVEEPVVVKMEVDATERRLSEPADGDDDDEDGYEMEYIEIGDDGLRTVLDCVNAVFDDIEGARVCLFCKARYDEGVSTPPHRYVNATLEELAAHCMAEHEVPWNTLRNNV